MHLQSLFLIYLTAWRPLGYTLTFIGLLFEGEITLFTAVFLTREGFFDVGDMLIIIFSSVIIGDILWYWAGKKIIPKYPKAHKFIERISKPFNQSLAKNPTKALIFGKFAYGAQRAVLLRAGMSEMTFRQFLKSELISVFIWVSVIGGLGFFSSISIDFLKKYLRFVEVSLVLGLVAFFVINHLFHVFSKKELEG